MTKLCLVWKVLCKACITLAVCPMNRLLELWRRVLKLPEAWGRQDWEKHLEGFGAERD